MYRLRDIRKNLKIRREKPQLWYLEKEQVGYIQIPKVATRSIQHAFVRHVLDDATLSDADIDKQRIKSVEPRHSAHLSLAHIRRDFAGRYFLFGFVRNPLARIYSCYRNKVLEPRNAGGRNILANHGVRLDMDFPEFVDTVIDIPDGKIDRHLRSLAWFLADEQGLVVDYVGKLETFNEDWTVIRERFGLQLPAHRNRSPAPVRMSTVCPRSTLEKIIDRYARDIELFGYTQAVEATLDEYR